MTKAKTEYDRVVEKHLGAAAVEPEIKEHGNKMVVYHYRLTGNETKDERYVNRVQELAEQSGGEFYFAYAYKDIYCFEIGGTFYNAKDVAKFEAAMEKIQRV